MYHCDWIRRHAERTPDRVAVIEEQTGTAYTYRQWDVRIDKVAGYLQAAMGVVPGERVAILAQNSVAYYEALFACARNGAILTTLNWRLAPPELAYILGDCEPSIVLYESEFAPTIAALRPELTARGYVRLDAGTDDLADAVPYATLLASKRAPRSVPRATYDDTWAIIYTSGTTGRPKGAQVTYGNFFYNAVGMGQAIGLTYDSVNLNVLPTFHIGGLGLYAGPTWHAGGTVVVMRAFDPGRLAAAIARHRVTHLLLVPAIYLVMLQQEAWDGHDLSSVQHWASGGSALPTQLLEAYAARGIIIQQGFGMTETGPTVFIIDREHALAKAGSVGKPVLHTDVRVVDRDGQILGAGAIGELCVRGGNVTSGYWNRPEATAETIVDGWLHTGDAARYDADGYYYIVDRWKDMFISGGENVYPAEVEDVLYQHPAVAEVAVIGVPHPKWQEVGRAIVVLKPEARASAAELRAFCDGKLARYKIPRSVVFHDGALPRTAAGKVLKRSLRQTHGAEVAE